MMMKTQKNLIQFTLNYLRRHKIINFDPNVEIKFQKMKGFYGWYDYSKNLIVLNENETHLDMVTTLVHELKHSEQVFKGRMTYGHNENVWRGKRIVDADDADEKTYLDLPWEIEARSVEKYGKQILIAYQKSQKFY